MREKAQVSNIIEPNVKHRRVEVGGGGMEGIISESREKKKGPGGGAWKRDRPRSVEYSVVLVEPDYRGYRKIKYLL